MNLNQLEYFVTLAKEVHYTRAAKMLSITQPTLSYAISELEKELNTKLFEKSGRNISLTRYGEQFLPYVEESLQVLHEGVNRVKELNGSKEGEVRLAYIYTLSGNFVPRLVRDFLNTYPDYKIHFKFTVGTTGEIIEGMKNGLYDVVFSSYIEGEPNVSFTRIGNQRLVVVVPKDHPLAIYDSVDLKDTIMYPHIYFSRKSGLRPIIDQIFEKLQVYPQIAYEMEEDTSMAGLVAQNFGIAVMPDIPVLKNMEVKRLSISSPEYERYVYLAYCKKKYLPPVAKAFIEYTKQESNVPS